MASNIEQTTVDFTDKSFEEKKKMIVEAILKATNFNDISARTLDWSTSAMPLFVNSSMVLTFLQTLNFERTCSQLTGKKTVDEIFRIVFNFDEM